MKDFVVTGRAAGFAVGSILCLTRDQSGRRAHATRVMTDKERKALDVKGLAKRLKGDDVVLVEATGPIEFKYAERITVIEAPGGLNKATLQDVAAADSETAQAALAHAAAKKRAADKVKTDAAAEAATADARRAEINAAAKKKKKAKAKKKTEDPPADPPGDPTKPAGLAEDETADQVRKGEGSMEPEGTVEREPDPGQASLV